MNNIVHLKEYLVKELPYEYCNVLSEIEELYNKDIWKLHQGNLSGTDRKEKISSFIKIELDNRKVDFSGYSINEIVNKIYDDIERYSILTKPLADPNVIKIIISSWEKVTIIFYDGSSINVGGFASPKQAKAILQRILTESDIDLSKQVTTIDYFSRNDTHMVAVLPPLVSEDTALFVCFTKANSREIDVKRNNLDFIRFCIEHGISTLFISNEDQNQQSFINYILSNAAEKEHVLSLGYHSNKQNHDNIIHLSTKGIETDEFLPHLLKLPSMLLSLNDVKKEELYIAFEAATWHTVLSTIKGNTLKQGHNQIATSLYQKQGMDFNVALRNTCDSFPLVVYITTTKDGEQRVMNISECYVDEHEAIQYITLFEFQMNQNISTVDDTTVVGSFTQVSNPSERMISIMKINGASDVELKALEMGLEM